MASPIISVNNILDLPVPSKFVVGLSDISATDAGRTEDMVMHKRRKGQAVTIEVAWSYLSTAEISRVLTAFDPEYVNVLYIDPKEGQEKRRDFYVGDRSAVMYNCTLDLWESVSFNLIQRRPDNLTTQS